MSQILAPKRSLENTMKDEIFAAPVHSAHKLSFDIIFLRETFDVQLFGY